MNAANPDLQERATRLTGKKGNITFEMWVEIDGKALEVYDEAEIDGGGSEAWIASEEGKVRSAEHHHEMALLHTDAAVNQYRSYFPQPYVICIRAKWAPVCWQCSLTRVIRSSPKDLDRPNGARLCDS